MPKMKSRNFLASMTALVTAVASEQVTANTPNEALPASASALTQSVVTSDNQNPFDFVLKRSDFGPQVLGYHSSHSSHSSHASHSSHYSSRY